MKKMFLIPALLVAMILTNLPIKADTGFSYILHEGSMTATISASGCKGDVVIPTHFYRNVYDYSGNLIDKERFSVTSIKDFQDCHDINSITIPNSIEYIYESAFRGCSNLTRVAINASIDLIADGMFSSCKRLTEITIPNTVTTIGDDAFNGCSGLTSIIIPNSVTTIGDDAFNGCLGLTEVTIGNSVATIGSQTFFGCSGLTEITIPVSVKAINHHAFKDCSKLVTVNFNAKECNWFWSPDAIFSGCDALKTLNIGDEVTIIPSKAFNGCSGLTEVTIPNSVTSIGGDAFSNCKNLSIINFNAQNCSSMGYNVADRINFPVPVFQGCNALKTLNIGDEVTIIPDSAFYGCSSLTELTIPNSVTSIGEFAFYECSGLESITIGESVTSIGNHAFCDVMPYNVQILDLSNWCNIEFGNITANPLSNTVKLFVDKKLMTTLTIPDDITKINKFAFYNAPIDNLIINENVTEIDSSAFGNCSKLCRIISLPTIPPTCESNSFGECNYILQVPSKEAIPDYSTANVWKNFQYIKIANENYVPSENTQTYNTINDIYCKNKWIIDREHCENLFLSHPFLKGSSQTRSRTAAIDSKRKQIYIGLSKQINVSGRSIEAAHLIIFDLETGEYKKELELSHDNAIITGLLCANQIGVDDFGNVWFAGYNPTQENPTKIYIIEDFETGACRQVGEWKLPSDEKDNAGRTDYYDVVGDVTGKQANAVAMSAVGNFGSNYNVNGLYRWELAKGATEWVGGFNGKVSATVAETCPETENGWGSTSAVVKIVKETDSDFSGSHIYVDGFNTYPTLYDTSLTMLEYFDFGQINLPHTCSNGITEFSLGNKKFIAYAENDVTKSNPYIYGYRVNICELGDNGSFDEMEYYWSVPEYGLGNYSNGGIRQHSIENYKVVDKNGKEGVYLLTYACYNGFGLYLIAEEGFDEASIASTEKIEINNIVPNSNAVEVSRYDIHGRKLSVPAKGVNIIKMSDGTTRKEFVR